MFLFEKLLFKAKFKERPECGMKSKLDQYYLTTSSYAMKDFIYSLVSFDIFYSFEYLESFELIILVTKLIDVLGFKIVVIQKKPNSFQNLKSLSKIVAKSYPEDWEKALENSKDLQNIEIFRNELQMINLLFTKISSLKDLRCLGYESTDLILVREEDISSESEFIILMKHSNKIIVFKNSFKCV